VKYIVRKVLISLFVVLCLIIISSVLPLVFQEQAKYSDQIDLLQEVMLKLEKLDIGMNLIGAPLEEIYQELTLLERDALKLNVSASMLYSIRKEPELYTCEDIYWMSRIISAEARGESRTGQLAVANVILNRVKSPNYPDSVKDVIFQTGQFCPVRTGSIMREPTQMAVESAKLALMGYRVLGYDVMFFYNPSNTSDTNWIRSREIAANIGRHSFATSRGR